MSDLKDEKLSVRLKNLAFFQMDDSEGKRIAYGPDQEWYSDNWRKQSGCGPTSAAIQTAYLAISNPAFRALYAGQTISKSEFVPHMDVIFEHVTPGIMGLNRLSTFYEAVQKYAASVGVNLTPHVFEVNGISLKLCRDIGKLAEFIRAGLENDCPIAFLALSNGTEKKLQPWHWVTITEAEISLEAIIAVASDEGNRISFDAALWYRTTPLSGGMIYFS